MKKIGLFNVFSGFMVMLFIAAFLPFLILSFYTQPSGDDYSYAVKIFDKSFWEIQIGEYMNWGSRYTATAILITNPISSGWFGGYNVISFFMLVSFVISIYYFLLTLLKNKSVALILLANFCFCYLFLLPHITSAFYWLAGSATYHFANVLSLIFLGIIYKANDIRSVKYKIIAFILSFLIIGCNEITMIYLDVFLFFILVYTYVKNKRVPYFHLSLMVFSGVLTCFVFLSPGNIARAELRPVHDLPFISIVEVSLIKSAVAVVRYAIIPFIINLLVFYNLRNYLKKLECSFLKLPIIFYVLFLGLFLFLGAFPSILAVGTYPPLRTVNVMFFVILIFVMIISYKITCLKFVQYIRIAPILQVFIVFSVVCSYVFVIRDRNFYQLSNNLYFGYKEMLDGTASRYSKEEKDRRKYIENYKADTVYVDPIKNNSVILTHSDLRSLNYFYNISLAKFYQKKAIVVKTNK